MPFFSVIIPVYRAEQYLRECVESVLAQTFEDWECVLVDDGSPDGCPAICDGYARQDGRVRVIHQSNSGVSAARNAGMRAASGEYLVFLDSDDYWCNANGLKSVFDALKGRSFEVDTLIYGVIKVDAEGNIQPQPQYPGELNHMTGDQIGRYLLERGTLLTSACEKAIRRQFVEKHGLYFDPDVFTAEDGEWVMHTTACSPRCCFLNETLYLTRRGTADVFRASSWERLAAMCGFLERYLRQTYASQAVKENVLGLGAYHYTLLCAQTGAGERGPCRAELLKRLKRMTEYWDYDYCGKVRKAHSVYRLLGFSVTVRLLSAYLKWR